MKKNIMLPIYWPFFVNVVVLREKNRDRREREREIFLEITLYQIIKNFYNDSKIVTLAFDKKISFDGRWYN